ncbi:hypothetical protein ACOI1H_16305 [Loktanella sp. DJP18]|uniref:hypothetical protein n=1 Tax=Loktanella sp. DJP18 TaxID=3409788 RepID=UPI003BB49375
MTDTIIDTLYGQAPVQSEGTVAGIPFYFRARGARWTMNIGADPLGSAAWGFEESFGTGFEAGFMDEDEARANITKAAAAFLDSDAFKSLTPFDLYNATEKAWEAGLATTFGKDARNARYKPEGQGGPGTRLRQLFDTRLAAMQFWEDARSLAHKQP